MEERLRILRADERRPEEPVVTGITGDKLVVGKPLDVELLRPKLQRAYDQGIRSLAVVLMHAYAWPEHELAIGRLAQEMGFTQEIIPPFYSIKESVFPFVRFPNSPITLSPEMKSTGEVMGQDMNLGMAFAKAQLAAQPPLPTNGNVFISVKREHKKQAVELAKNFVDLGFTICATEGTADSIEEAGISVKRLFKLSEGARPNVVDVIKNGETSLIINAPHGMIPRKDDDAIRREALNHNICIMTTMTSAFAAVEGIRAMIENPLQVKSIQEYHELLDS